MQQYIANCESQSIESQNSVPPILDSHMPPVLAFGESRSCLPGRTPVTTSAIERGSPRWRKRLLFAGLGLSLLVGVSLATSPRPKLLYEPKSIPSRFDATIQLVANQVDDAINVDIAAYGLSKAKAADWRAITRRISLALIGNGLSLEEIRVLEPVSEKSRPEWWTEYLLRDRRSSDYLAERWTRATVGTNQGPFLIFRRRKYVDWIADHFEKNTPYDVMVRQLIEAKGSWTDAPQVNFLTATMDDADNKKPDAIRLAGRTSRAFLAQRIDCLQCHQDYLGKVNFSDMLGDSQNESQTKSDEYSIDIQPNRAGEQADLDRKSTRLNSSHPRLSRMPSSA